MNQNIINNFEKLIQQLKTDTSNKTNGFKIRNFIKVLNIIKQLGGEITSIDQIKNVKGIGKGSLSRISEILEKGKLSELNNTDSDKGQVLSDLQRITGIGPAKSKKLFEDNLTLDIILNTYNKNPQDELFKNFTHHQMIGIKYFKDIESRIPYSEIENINGYFNTIISNIDKDLEFQICGSFRREKNDSGDIDILLTHKNIKTANSIKNLEINYLKELIEELREKQFIKDDLTYNGDTKYMGMCKYEDNPCRRIDIRLIPQESYGAALLYFTGSGEFNKNMRTYALKNGYTINEYGIFKLNSDKSKGPKVKTNSEKDIFDVLKIEYIEPKYRTSLVKF